MNENIIIYKGIQFKKGNGIWSDLFFRLDPQKSFDKKNEYIKKNYMYMYSDLKCDFFKHIYFRTYIKFKIK